MPAPLDRPEAKPAPAAPLPDLVHVDSLLVVDFSAQGNSGPFRSFGWGAPEARLIWALGRRSALKLPAPWDTRPRVLELDVNPCRALPHVSAQMLSVTVNGRFFGSRLLTQRSVLRCTLPPEVWQGCDTIEVVFDHPNFLVPRLLRQSGDGRPLAVSFFSARLYSRREPGPTIALPVLPAAPAGLPPLAETAAPVPAVASPAARAEIYEFGLRRSGSALAREGWSPPEARFQWTDGPFARLDIPAPATPGARLLRLTCSGFTHPPRLPVQDFAVSLGGRILAQFGVGQRTTFALPLPEGDAAAAASLSLGLHLPVAARPSEVGAAKDERQLGLCVHSVALEPLSPALLGWAGRRVDDLLPASEPPRLADRFCGVRDEDLPAKVAADLGCQPAELLARFESLGETAEFGQAQRQLGVAGPSLFGFGLVPLDSLLRGFADTFAALADPAAVSVAKSEGKRPEFVAAVEAYRMRWRSFVAADTGAADAVRQDHAARLGPMRQAFLDLLRGSGRIFVLRPLRRPTAAEMLPLLQELNRHGRNTLLYVVSGAPPERNGAVETVGPGLLRGHVGAFAPEESGTVKALDWLRLCANAWTLRPEAKAEPPAPKPEPAPPAPPVAARAETPPAKPAAAAPKAEPFVATATATRFCGLSGDGLRARVAAELGFGPAELLRGFESLGEDEEFGLVQRKLDIELLGLFRFATVPLASLLRGFADDFVRLTDADAITIATEGTPPHYVLAADAYGMRWRSLVPADQADAETTRRQQATKLGFMRRKLLESLRTADKLFVLKRARALASEEVRPVAEALARFGTGTLLIVEPGAPPDSNGAAERLGPHLLRGHVGGFAPGPDMAATISADDWLRLCANAWMLRKPGAASMEPPATAAPAPEPAKPAMAASTQPDPLPENAATLLRVCDSLGDTAEFGLLQRRAGVEALSLFRFAQTPLPGLLAAFADDFAAIGDAAAAAIAVTEARRPGSCVTVARYGIIWPTEAHADEAEPDATLQRHVMRLGYLRRKFLDSLKAGGKLFVLRRATPFAEAEVAPLVAALARFGRHTVLTVAADPAAAEAVVQAAPGLLRGTLKRLAPETDPAASDAAAWIGLIGKALPLHQVRMASPA